MAQWLTAFTTLLQGQNVASIKQFRWFISTCNYTSSESSVFFWPCRLYGIYMDYNYTNIHLCSWIKLSIYFNGVLLESLHFLRTEGKDHISNPCMFHVLGYTSPMPWDGGGQFMMKCVKFHRKIIHEKEELFLKLQLYSSHFIVILVRRESMAIVGDPLSLSTCRPSDWKGKETEGTKLCTGPICMNKSRPPWDRVMWNSPEYKQYIVLESLRTNPNLH